MKLLNIWLRAKKILNANKTKIILFRPKSHLVYTQKVRHLLKTYYSLFNFYLIYGCQVWGQYQGTELKKNRNIAKESHAPVKKEIKNRKTKILNHNSKRTFCI